MMKKEFRGSQSRFVCQAPSTRGGQLILWIEEAGEASLHISHSTQYYQYRLSEIWSLRAVLMFTVWFLQIFKTC